MEKFELIPTYTIEDDLVRVNVCLSPSGETICNYIRTCKNYSDLSSALSDVNNYITEMTPILFNDFQNMDNISSGIRSNYEL